MNGNPIMALMQLMQMGRNPQEIVQNAMRNNPQVNAILQQAHQSGMTMEQFTRQYAKQNGIDLNPLLGAMRQRGIM